MTVAPHVIFTRPWWHDWPWNWPDNRRKQQLAQAIIDRLWATTQADHVDACTRIIRYSPPTRKEGDTHGNGHPAT